MIWLDVDGARAYLVRGGGTPPSRKVIYSLIRQGLKAKKVGREWFTCETWVDEFMQSPSKENEKSAIPMAIMAGGRR